MLLLWVLECRSNRRKEIGPVSRRLGRGPLARPKQSCYKKIMEGDCRPVMSYTTDLQGKPSLARLPRVPSETILAALGEVGLADCSLHELFNGLLRDYRAVKVEKHA